MFFRVLSKIFSLYLFRLGEAVWGVILKKFFFPQGVDHGNAKNIRFFEKYFFSSGRARNRRFYE